MLTVNTLTCKNHLNFAVPCLKSFLTHCKDQIAFRIYNDGSLNTKDVENLKREFAGAEIVDYREFFQHSSEKLGKYPRILRWRKISAFALKIFDIPLNSPDKYLLLDSDIMFFRDFYGFNNQNLKSAQFIAMRDLITNSYGINFGYRYLNKKTKIRIPDRINTGFLYMDKEIYDLDHLEWLLDRFHDDQLKGWSPIEQFCYATLARDKKAYYWNPQQLVMTLDPVVLRNTVAIHFIHNIRNKMNGFLNSSYSDQGPICLNFEPVTYHPMIIAALERAYEKVFVNL